VACREGRVLSEGRVLNEEHFTASKVQAALPQSNARLNSLQLNNAEAVDVVAWQGQSPRQSRTFTVQVVQNLAFYLSLPHPDKSLVIVQVAVYRLVLHLIRCADGGCTPACGSRTEGSRHLTAVSRRRRSEIAMSL
jgi:hypothetical protein